MYFKIIFLIVSISACIDSQCQNPIDCPFELQLEIANTNIGQIDKIFFKAMIINKSDDKYKTRAIWDSYFPYKGFGEKPLLEYRMSSSDEWKPLKGSNYRGIAIEPIAFGPPYFHWMSDSSRITSSTYEYIPVKPSTVPYEYYFNAPTNYFIRAYYPFYYYSNTQGTEHIHVDLYSNEIKITVSNYSSKDIKAFDWLKALEIPHFIYMNVHDYKRTFFREKISNNISNYTIPKLTYLIEKFPESKFAGWANYFLAKYYVDIEPERRKNREKYIEQAKDILNILISKDIKDENLRRKIQETLKAWESF